MGFKQLAGNYNFSTTTSSGITLTNNYDGSISVTGTSTALTIPSICSVTLVTNHTYLLLGCPAGGGNNTYDLRINGFATGVALSDVGVGVMRKYTDTTAAKQISIVVRANVTVNVDFIPQLFDLTDIYGMGLEPITIAEFRSRYPNPYYAPNNGYMRLRMGARALLSELTWSYNSTYDYYYTNNLTSNSPDYNRLKAPSSSSEKIAAYIPGFTAVSYDDRNKNVGPRVYYDPGYSLVTIRGITSIPTNTYIDYATNVLEYAVINNKKKGELTYNGVTYVFDNTRPTKMAQLNVYGPSSSAPYFIDSTDNALTLPVTGQGQAHIDIQSYLGCPSQFVPSAQRPFTINGEVISTGIPPWSNKITFTNEAATWVDTASVSHSIPPMQTGEYRYVITQYFDPL